MHLGQASTVQVPSWSLPGDPPHAQRHFCWPGVQQYPVGLCAESKCVPFFALFCCACAERVGMLHEPFAAARAAGHVGSLYPFELSLASFLALG